jgi:hypothetical protein
MVYLSTNFHGRSVTIRDLEESDVETLVSYWHDSDPAYLASLGVNLSKLSSRDQTRDRFLSSIPGSQEVPDRATFIVTSGGRPVAYTNLNFRSMDEVYVHFHTLERGPLVKALVYFLFPEMIGIFFSRFPIAQLTMQTSPENRNINRFLENFGLVPRRAYLLAPDGMARAGQFNIYEILRATASGVGRQVRVAQGQGE